MTLMSRRVTIMIDDDLAKKIRTLQAKRILSTSSAVSFSKILNDVARKGLK